MPTVAAVVLAAGDGRRFGGPKALAPFNSCLLIEHVTRLAAAAGCSPIIAVIGAQARRVREVSDLSDVQLAEAPDWASGMSASLRCGLGAAAALSCDAAIILLVDQPLIGPEAVRRLAAAAAAGAVAAMATYDGRQGHPVMLAKTVWDEVIATGSGDQGAREWLQANADRVERVACDDTGDPADADTVTQLRAMEQHHRQPGS